MTGRDPMSPDAVARDPIEQLAESLVTAIADVIEEPACDCGALYRDHEYWEDRIYDVNGRRCPKSVTGGEYRYSATQTARHLRSRQLAAARYVLDACLRSRGGRPREETRKDNT